MANNKLSITSMISLIAAAILLVVSIFFPWWRMDFFAPQYPFTSMISLIAAAILLVVSIFFPWWRMDFFAPQYPEGLDIIVYPYTLAGDIEIVNGLNHYIGMGLFSNESFPELAFMPYIVAGFALLTLIVADRKSVV